MFSPIGVGVSFVSCFVFWKLNNSLKYNVIPVPHKYAGLTRHKWRNVIGSLVHATVVSVVGIYW